MGSELFEVQLQTIQTQIRVVFLFLLLKFRTNLLWCRERSGLVIRRYRLYFGLEVFQLCNFERAAALRFGFSIWLL